MDLLKCSVVLLSSLVLINCFPLRFKNTAGKNEVYTQPEYTVTHVHKNEPCSPPWVLFNQTGQCYRFYNATPKNWTDARHSTCRKEGGELVSIGSEVENDFVRNLTNGKEAWTGLSDKVTDNKTWAWTDGHPLNYTKWAPGEPDKPFPQDCGAMNFGTDDGQWVSYQCEELMSYVCKKNVTSNLQNNIIENQHLSLFKRWYGVTLDFFISIIWIV